MGEMSIFGLILALLAGGPNDLLDYIPTDAYWKHQAVTVNAETLIKELTGVPAGDISKLIEDLGANDYKVREATQKKIAAMGPTVIGQLEKATQAPDPEIASRAKALIGQFNGSKAAAVRRLMVMRTLGEMRSKEAVAVLRPLLASKEPFEADYAAAALAAIEGRPHARPQPDAGTRAADLGVLPAGLDFVAQAVAIRTPAAALATQPASDLARAPTSPAEHAAAMIEMLTTLERTPDTYREHLVDQAITAAETVGNIRIDGLTVGSAEGSGGQSDLMVVMLRGQYDHQKAPAAIARAIDSFFGGLAGLWADPMGRRRRSRALQALRHWNWRPE